MASSNSSISIVVSILLFASACAYADDSQQEIKMRIGIGNPVEGKSKAIPCRVCHGDEDNPEEPMIPKLAGQYADYIQRQIYNYQEGTRSDPDMTRISSTLTNRRDLADIASYFASLKQMKGTPVANEEGEKLYQKRGCLNCHGEFGKGKPSYNSIFPIVGGQKKGYLIKQMKDFKSGERTSDISGIMTLVMNQMTYNEIVAVAEYMSGQ